MRRSHRAASLALSGAILLCLALPHPAQAKRRFVPRQHKTLQAAIDAAAPGDTIWVAPGIYRGPFRLTKKLVLYGEKGADKTILDGRDSVRVLHVEGVNTASLIGFTVRNGKSNSGGGVYCVRDTAFQIGDCVFTNNWESALSVWDCNAVTVGGCTLRGNKGSAIVANNSLLGVFDSKFIENEGHEGGAISLTRTRLFVPLRNLVFEKNRAIGSVGGAVCAADSSQGTVVGCAFTDNTSDVAGGGLAMTGATILNVSRSVFTRNHAAAGGAIQCDHSRMNVGLCVFDSNSSLAFGGAISIAGRGFANVNPILTNNTLYQNSVQGDGANLFFTDVSPEVRKNIFVVGHDQRAVSGLQTTPRYDCNLIWDPSGGAVGALPSVNTWVGDPLFCDAAHGDFSLRDLSPAFRAPCGPIGAFIEKPGCASFRLQPAN